jgi:hypothetical protein
MQKLIKCQENLKQHYRQQQQQQQQQQQRLLKNHVKGGSTASF